VVSEAGDSSQERADPLTRLPADPPPDDRVNVLLVDDQPANLVALEAMLQGLGQNLIKAESGREALKWLLTHDFAVILLDVKMPGMDGFEVARRVKKMAGYEEIPVIFITAICTEDPFVREGYAAGAVDYFSKPFDPDILRRKVKVYASFQHKSNLLLEKERLLRETEELLQAARAHSATLERLDVGVLISDTEGRICQTNETLLKILDSVDQAKTDRYGEFLAWWDKDGQLLKNHDGPLLRALKQGQSSHNTIVEIKCFDQSLKSIALSATPLRGRYDAITGAVVVVRDITAQREGDDAIEQRIVHLISPTSSPFDPPRTGQGT